jgi:hypothetical protein
MAADNFRQYCIYIRKLKQVAGNLMISQTVLIRYYETIGKIKVHYDHLESMSSYENKLSCILKFSMSEETVLG